jgi:hypothetical protein
VKFKTTLSIPQTSVERPSTSNNLEQLAAAAAANRRRQYTSSDYTTELSLYNSKSDSWALNVTDEIIQTSSINSVSSLLNGACTDAERQQQQQRQHSYTQEDETVDLLSTSKPRTSSNYLQHPLLKPASSNLVMTTENPWKKLSNVRYKLDGNDANQTNYHPIHAQHITFV